MPFQILHNDITNMNTDAIVNAANSKLLIGGGVCGAIFKAAGEAQLQKECEQIRPCLVGHAVITKGYNLKAKYSNNDFVIVRPPGVQSITQLIRTCN